jgi:hypothetical protein
MPRRYAARVGGEPSSSTSVPFFLYAVLGVAVALGAISFGWLVLGPVMLVVVLLSRTRVRHGLAGTAVGAGLLLLFVGLTALDRQYGVRFVEMGVSLFVFGVLALVRRAWLTPA